MPPTNSGARKPTVATATIDGRITSNAWSCVLSGPNTVSYRQRSSPRFTLPADASTIAICDVDGGSPDYMTDMMARSTHVLVRRVIQLALNRRPHPDDDADRLSPARGLRAARVAVHAPTAPAAVFLPTSFVLGYRRGPPAGPGR